MHLAGLPPAGRSIHAAVAADVCLSGEVVYVGWSLSDNGSIALVAFAAIAAYGVVEGAQSYAETAAHIELTDNVVKKKPINLPSVTKVTINLSHIWEPHTYWTNPPPQKDKFPWLYGIKSD